MLRVLLFILAALILAPSAAADGKVFRHGIPEMPPIPDQQAIIAWDAATNTQTLAIETRFDAGKRAATSTDVPSHAWIIPLPGPEAPTISPATTGLFPTVRTLFQPRVDDRPAPKSIGLSIAFAVLLLAYIGARATGELTSMLLMAVAVVVILFLLLPTLGSARGLAAAPSTLRVLARDIVGSYETAVVSAADGADSGAALLSWCKDNGFAVPREAEGVLSDYARRNWVFAAVKLRGVAAGAAATPHPLVFRFKTKEPVYPMALTGVGNPPLTLDLYVFGTERAAADGLAEKRCDRVVVSTSAYPFRMQSDEHLAIGHPGLLNLLKGCTVATKLSGTLTPQQQTKDLPIKWQSFERSGWHAFSPRGSRNRAIEWGFAVLPVGMMVVIGAAALGKHGAKWAFTRVGWAALAGCVVGLTVYAITPTVEVVRDGGRARYLYATRMSQLARMVASAIGDVRLRPTLDAVSSAAVAAAKEMELDVRVEDSPGNFTVREESPAGAISLVWYDAVGAPQSEIVWDGK